MSKLTVTNKKIYYQRVFLAAAIWNWVASILVLVGDRQNRSTASDTSAANASLNAQMVSTLVGVFGLGYFWISQDTSKHRGMVKLGVIGKTIVFLSFLRYFISGKLSASIMAVGAVDLVFVGLFTEFLLNTQKTEA